jgi:hypothetical protein
MRRLTTHLLFLLGFTFFTTYLTFGQQVDQIRTAVDPARLVVLSNHHPQWASKANDQGPLPPDAAVDHLTLVLSRTAQQEEALSSFLAEQQDFHSPNYHRWLTSTELGERFGLSDHDLAALTGWLQSQGLHVNWVSPSRMFVSFGGPAAAVGSAFHTEVHRYGNKRISVATDPFIPAALQPAIKSIHGLYTVEDHPLHSVQLLEKVSPDGTTSTGTHFITPDDFWTIYGYTGVSTIPIPIAILGRSRTDFSDFDHFRELTEAMFSNPTEIVPTSFGGVDPGPALTAPPSTTVSIEDQSEATLDVERAGSTGETPPLVLVVATEASGGIEADAQYVVQTTPAPAQVLSISFGECESSAGPSAVAFWDTLFQQAAAEGISALVSSGDSGASGCDAAFAAPPASPQPNSPNYICSSSYATCVGGTEFNDTGNPTQYWTNGNTASFSSALSYIPEGAWNEPLNSTSSPVVAASGGGVSTVIATPGWQTGTGVPAARSGRYTPDVAFSAAAHDGYFGCFAAGGADCVVAANGSFHFGLFSGTSAAAPAMAGITSLLDGKLQSAQGNLNPQLYQLASTAPTVFHDVTVGSSGVSDCQDATPSMCNNSIPGPTSLSGGQAGFGVTPGYDEVTGLGSLNIENFLNAYPGPPAIALLDNSFSLTFPTQLLGYPEGPSQVAIWNSGSAPLDPIAVTITGPAASDFVATNQCQSPLAAGADCSVSIIFTASAAGARSANLTLTSANGSNSPRTVPLSGGGTTTLYTPLISVNANPNTIAVSQPVTISVFASQAAGAPPLLPSGTVVVTSGNYVSSSFPVGVSFANINIPGGSLPIGNDTVTATFTPDSASSAVYGSGSNSTVVTVVAALNPGFSISGGPINIAPGATSGNTSVIAIDPVNGFQGTVTLTAAITTSPAGAQHPPTLSFGTTSPASVANASGTSATLTVLTTGPATGAHQASSLQFSWYASGAVSLGCLLFMGMPHGRRRWRAFLGTVLLLICMTSGVSACGGGSGGSSTNAVTDPGTTAGSYTITITGTSGNITQTGTIGLTVQ